MTPRSFLDGLSDGMGGWVADYYRLSPRLVRRLDSLPENIAPPAVSSPTEQGAAVAAVASRLEQIELSTEVASMLIEEWLFLTGQSTIVSRIKKPFVAFKRAGGRAVEITARATLRHVDVGTKLDEGDYARAGIKWVAVGGSPVLSLLGPWGIPPAMLLGWFLLIDP